MRQLQGLGTLIKEQKIADHRPKPNGAPAPTTGAENLRDGAVIRSKLDA